MLCLCILFQIYSKFLLNIGLGNREQSLLRSIVEIVLIDIDHSNTINIRLVTSAYYLQNTTVVRRTENRSHYIDVLRADYRSHHDN